MRPGLRHARIPIVDRALQIQRVLLRPKLPLFCEEFLRPNLRHVSRRRIRGVRRRLFRPKPAQIQILIRARSLDRLPVAGIAVLARKSRKAEADEAPEYVAAMLMAVSMMFLRFLILIGIFSRETLAAIYPYLLVMALIAGGTAWYIHSRRPVAIQGQMEGEEDSSNPLEFKVALIFAMLFIVFTVVTHYTLVYAGTGGLTVLSFVSGLSDITPFILNLVQGTGGVAILVITACSLQAILSNILVNFCYGLFFAGRKSALRPWMVRGFGVVIAANAVLLTLFYLL